MTAIRPCRRQWPARRLGNYPSRGSSRAEFRRGGQTHHLGLIAIVVAGQGKGQGTGDGIQYGVQPRLLGLVKSAQHMGSNWMAFARMAHAHSGRGGSRHPDG